MKKKEVKKTTRRKISVPKNCYFCEEKKLPWFSDTSVLKRFITERGKIIARSKNGLCSKHQDRLSLAIKHARHLAMIPFVVKG